MSKYIYNCKVKIFDTEEKNEQVSYCLLVADNYKDALEQITKFFDEDEIITVELSYNDEGSLIFLPKDVYEDYTKENRFHYIDYVEIIKKVQCKG